MPRRLSRAALIAALLFVWMLQYSVVVPSYWAIHLLAGASKLGLLFFMLLFVPIIGWAVVAYKVFGNHQPSAQSATPYKPWGAQLVK